MQINPRHHYGHNLHFYYLKWLHYPSKEAFLLNCKKYGVPLYGASFVPHNALKSSGTDAKKEDEDSGNRPNYVIFAGGGGEGRSGIPNSLVISLFDSASNSLSDQPVEKLETGDDLPYRMAVHPGGEGVVCLLPKSCSHLRKCFDKLEDIGQQVAVTLSQDGSLLAVGGEDGTLRMFNPDGKYLVSVGSGPGRVWDISSSIAKASLSKENDEVFGFCKFSLNGESDPFLYVTAMRDRGGSIVKWNTTTWKRRSSKHVVWGPISAFNVSYDEKLLSMLNIVNWLMWR
uniref:Putative WD40/YVTN repeat-like-containing domain-containing protein n=1 Tax=Helianthus annuus TaxID=4232 RepID=A0A251T4Q3_HELAN